MTPIKVLMAVLSPMNHEPPSRGFSKQEVSIWPLGCLRRIRNRSDWKPTYMFMGLNHYSYKYRN